MKYHLIYEARGEQLRSVFLIISDWLFFNVSTLYTFDCCVIGARD